MKRLRRGGILIISVSMLIATTRSGIAQLDQLNDSIVTPNGLYIVLYTDDDPNDLDFFPMLEAQEFADALDNTNAPTPGAPNGYHNGYLELGFRAPFFSVFPQRVFVHNCQPSCDTGAAWRSRIEMPTVNNGTMPPAPLYLGEAESCKRAVLGHELFHHVQYAYDQNFDRMLLGWAIEGAARYMQDKVYADLDVGEGCVNIVGIDFHGEVDDYLQSGFSRSLFDFGERYGTALFWSYLGDQLGQVSTEPGRGADFLADFWERHSVLRLAGQADGRLALDLALALRDETLLSIFQDFTIANYTKEFNVSTLDDGLRYRHADENDGNGTLFADVPRSWDPQLMPGQSAASMNVDVVPWAAEYLEADITCPDHNLVRVEAEGSSAGYAAVTVDNAGAPPVVSFLKKGSGSHFAAAFVQAAGPIDRLGLVVTGFEEDVESSVTFQCDTVRLNILEPTNANMACVGDATAPEQLLIRLNVFSASGEESVEGLRPEHFQVFVGDEVPGDEATVLSASYVGASQYWLAAAAPAKGANGVYHLHVRFRDNPTKDVQLEAVRYDPGCDTNQVLVLDRSGSMLDNDKLDAAKSAATMYVDIAGTADRIGVVSFGGNNSESPPNDDSDLEAQLQPANAAHRNLAKAAIAGIATNTMVLTSIGDGLFRAQEELDFRGNPIATDFMVLLSDGMQNEARRWADIRDLIVSEGTHIHAIALGPRSDQELLQEIARETDGHFDYVAVVEGSGAAAASISGAPPSPLLANSLANAFVSASENVLGHERLWMAETRLTTNETVPFRVFDEDVSDARLTLHWEGGTVSPSVRRPDGTTLASGVDGVRIYGSDSHSVFHIPSMEVGTWEIRHTVTSGEPTVAGFLTATPPSGTRLVADFSPPGSTNPQFNLATNFAWGAPVVVQAMVTDLVGPVQNADLFAFVEHPDGRETRLPLLDDGNHDDGVANDGVYAARYVRTTEGSLTGLADSPSVPPDRGSYIVTITGRGMDNDGRRFERIKTGAFHVLEPREPQVEDPDGDGMPTAYESYSFCLDPQKADGDDDPDLDEATSLREYLEGTDPCRPDTDDGGEADGSEILAGQDPLNPDDDALPRPVDVDVQSTLVEHLPEAPQPRPLSNLIRYPIHPEYALLEIMRSESASGPFATVAQLSPNIAVGGYYYDEGLSPGVTYYYRLRMRTSLGAFSAPSRTISGTPSDGPVLSCVSDCDDSGRVTVDEIVISVNIALGDATIDECSSADRNSDGSVTVDELVAAVNSALTGCS